MYRVLIKNYINVLIYSTDLNFLLHRFSQYLLNWEKYEIKKKLVTVALAVTYTYINLSFSWCVLCKSKENCCKSNVDCGETLTLSFFSTLLQVAKLFYSQPLTISSSKSISFQASLVVFRHCIKRKFRYLFMAMNRHSINAKKAH